MSHHTPVPDGALLFDHQIAGHVHGNKKTKLGLLKHKDGSVLKPILRSDERTTREQKFYERVFSSAECPPELVVMRAFVPKYRGIWKTSICGEDVEYLKLDDLTAAFRRPSVLDVKIGAKTYDPLASPEKVALESKKYAWSQQIGFRILGMRVFDQAEQKYTVYGKDFGLKQTPDTVLEAFRLFLGVPHQGSPDFLPDLLHQLEVIQHWFESQQLYAFYSSSLLLLYESDPVPPSSGDNHSKPEANAATGRHCAAKMIDFAHVFPTVERDSNYLFGLRSLMTILRRIAKG